MVSARVFFDLFRLPISRNGRWIQIKLPNCPEYILPFLKHSPRLFKTAIPGKEIEIPRSLGDSRLFGGNLVKLALGNLGTHRNLLASYM